MFQLILNGTRFLFVKHKLNLNFRYTQKTQKICQNHIYLLMLPNRIPFQFTIHPTKMSYNCSIRKLYLMGLTTNMAKWKTTANYPGTILEMFCTNRPAKICSNKRSIFLFVLQSGNSRQKCLTAKMTRGHINNYIFEWLKISYPLRK